MRASDAQLTKPSQQGIEQLLRRFHPAIEQYRYQDGPIALLKRELVAPNGGLDVDAEQGGHRRTDDPIASSSSPCPLVRGLSSIIGIPRDAGVDAAIALHLPQETLAQLIGSTRQRVNQILHDWETADLLTQRYGLIVLLDQSKLEKLLS